MFNKIGVQNFRVFRDYTEFEIRPITLLTGPNNAGKSSFTKLLLLLKNGIQKLNFQEGLHNLENFDKVLNWEKKDDILKLRFENRISILGDDFFVEYEYKKAKIDKITIANSNVHLLEFSIQKPKTIAINDFFNIVENNQKLDFNINYLIDLIYSLNIKRKIYEKTDDSLILKLVEKGFKDFNLDDNKYLLQANFNNLKSRFNEVIKNDSTGEKLNFMRDCALLNEINKLEKDYLLYEVIANGENITEHYKIEILEIQEKEFSNSIFHLSNSPDINLDECINVLKSVLPQINNKVKKEIQNFYKIELNTDAIEVKESLLGNIIFIEKLYKSEIETGEYFTSTLFDEISKFSLGIEYDLKKLEYISANRGSQKRVLANKSENDIDEIVVSFFNKKDKNEEYLQEILEILEIPGELIVERFENVISIVYLKINNKKIALSDLGYGYSQIIPIILKLINMISFHIILSSEETIIIEEPEANLHPNLQSKLADVFVTTLKHYPNLKFIIETHSEYFIRKLQYLTAKKEVSAESSVIYYFNADKYVNNQEPKVKKIDILENGNLSETFGPGFYDETTRLQFDLMKLNQEQKN